MSLGIDNNTILYLKGDTFEDSSLYKNSILNNNIAINNNGKFGSCYNFTQNSTSLSTSGGVRLPQNTFTIDWWEKNITNLADKTTSFINNLPLDTSTSTYSFLIGKSTGYSNPRIWISSNNSSWDVAQTIDIGNPCLNEWVHRAVVNDGTNIKCYENGKLFTTIALGGKSIYPLDSEICFNSLRSGANPYYAYIDEIRISNTVRWHADFTPPINQYSFIEELEENATLFDVVERIELLNELKQEEKNNLINLLLQKGIECSDNDKMLSLINKANNIKEMNEIVCGYSWNLYSGELITGDKFASTTPTELHRFSNFPNSGGCIIKVSLLGSGNTSYAYIRHIRGGVVLEEKKISNYHTQSAQAVHLVWENQNILIGDEIVILGSHRKSGSTPAKVYDVSISCDLPY